MGRVHRSLAFMMARYNTFLTESGVGKAPRCLVTFLSWALIDSTAFDVAAPEPAPEDDFDQTRPW